MSCMSVVFMIAAFRLTTTKSELTLKGVYQDDLSLANFISHNNSYLRITEISRELVEDHISCCLLCLSLTGCYSVNVAANPGPDNLMYWCEALSGDKYHFLDKFDTSNTTSRHFSIKNKCMESPCQDGASCYPIYETDDYRCVCPKGATGRHCEIPITTCAEVLSNLGNASNGAYFVKTGSNYTKVYCHMDEIPGCGEGAWTLIMKTDGTKQTFTYDSEYWTNRIAYNISAGQTCFDRYETKLPTYWTFNFTRLCLGMAADPSSDINWVGVDYRATSLFAVVDDGNYRALSVGRNSWKSLLAGSSLQRNCNKEGFNVKSNGIHTRMGIIANNENTCPTSDSYIGFGVGSQLRCPDAQPTTGNTACYDADNGHKAILAQGYILAK